MSASRFGSAALLLLRRRAGTAAVGHGVGGGGSTTRPPPRGRGLLLSNYGRHHHHVRMMSTLILSEPVVGDDNASPSIPAATCSAVTAAKSLQEPNDPITLLVAGGTKLPTHIPEGVTRILHYESPTSSAVLTSESIALAMADAVQASDPPIQHVVGTSTKHGASVIPRVAALLGASPVTDVVQILSPDTFVRPMYAGNVLAKVQTRANALPQVLTIRPTSYDKAVLVVDIKDVSVTTRPLPIFEHSRVVVKDPADVADADAASTKDALVDLGSARVVVSGGRGMKEGSHFVLLKKLAAKLDPSGASVGASRAAVDAGMAPNDWQVGQTGKVVAPDLYVAVGISGAIQHLSGMKDSKVIVAINKDPDAPIFQVADYGLVADLFVAVPELTGKL